MEQMKIKGVSLKWDSETGLYVLSVERSNRFGHHRWINITKASTSEELLKFLKSELDNELGLEVSNGS